MPWVWIAELPPTQAPAGCLTTVAFTDLSGAVTRLAAWPAGRRPHPGAVRADAAFVDPAGPVTDLTVQLVEPGREPLFDDPAVQYVLSALQSRQSACSGAVTSLVRDESHWSGALIAGRHDTAGLGLLGPVRRGRLDAGFAAARCQVLHGTQRYQGLPWPCTG